MIPIKRESTQQTNARLAILINSGAIDKSELTSLKVALRRLKKHGDIRRLSPRAIRLLQDFYNSTTDALLNSQVATVATGKAIRQSTNEGVALGLQKDVVAESVSKDPPQMLVLQRKGIRIFPDGKRVALYTNEKMNISVTIPYSSAGFQSAMGVTSLGESKDIVEAKKAKKPVNKNKAKQAKKRFATMDDIHDIVDSKKHKVLQFKDGSTMPVDMFTAKAVRDLHLDLQDSKNRKYMETAIQNRQEFMKVINFAIGRRKKS